jgi:hypothetical protein
LRRFLLLFALLSSVLFLSSQRAYAGALKDVSLSAGASAGLSLGWVEPLVAPTLSTSVELGGEKLRWYTAIELSPTFYLDVDDGSVFLIPPVGSLAMGPTYGSETLRVGPYGYLGLYAAGAGLRAAVITKPGKRGGRHGWELRSALNVTLPPSVTTTALYSWHLPLRNR